MMSDIFIQRLRIAKKRQLEIQPLISNFVDFLNAKIKKSPYSMNNSDYEMLTKIKCFATRPHGPEYFFQNKNKYLFRFDTFGRISKSPFFDPTFISDFTDLEKYFEITNLDWLGLSRLTSGSFPSNRDFSFWTTEDIENNSNTLIDNLLHLGLLQNQIVSGKHDPVLLRIKIDDFVKINVKIPSELEGIDHLPFLPSDLKQNAPKALNLMDQNNFLGGYTELVVKKIETSLIDIKPIDRRLLANWKDSANYSLENPILQKNIFNYLKSINE